MADIQHSCNRANIPAQSENPQFLLTNRHGDYLALGAPNTSNYNGLFMRRDDAYYKVVFDVAPSRPLRNITIFGDAVLRGYDGMTQECVLLDRGMLLTCDGEFTVTLDCKRLYDESDQGRAYDISLQDAEGVRIVMVSYTKFSDAGLSNKQYTLHAAFATDLVVRLLQEWRQVYYTYDIRRGTANTPWVHDAFGVSGKGTLAAVVAPSQDEACRKALEILGRKDAFLREHHAAYAATTPTLPTQQQLAWRALDALRTHTGIMAGLPWFFQEWSRDELIACGGLLAIREYGEVVRILDKWYSVVRSDGTLPAMYPDKGITSSDASGWLGKRTRDLLVLLADHNKTSLLPPGTAARWRDATARILDGWRSRMRDGLVWNGKNTTWMDTSHDDDGRAGARIEIQALLLALFDAHAHLCTMTRAVVDPARATMAREVLDAVHRRLYVGGRLLDGLHEDGSPDTTVRPNVFIAWYVAPRLFSQSEWHGIFATTLPQLWLPWGGVSSIDTADRNHHPYYTGENVASYHRGDSWYFVNNMAAMALHTIDPEGYKTHVDAIVRASVHDLLALGFAGHTSEISSAAAQEAAGCYAQAWSASTLLELLQRIERA
jgi:hypothetical protein